MVSSNTRNSRFTQESVNYVSGKKIAFKEKSNNSTIRLSKESLSPILKPNLKRSSKHSKRRGKNYTCCKLCKRVFIDLKLHKQGGLQCISKPGDINNNVEEIPNKEEENISGCNQTRNSDKENFANPNSYNSTEIDEEVKIYQDILQKVLNEKPEPIHLIFSQCEILEELITAYDESIRTIESTSLSIPTSFEDLTKSEENKNQPSIWDEIYSFCDYGAGFTDNRCKETEDMNNSTAALDDLIKELENKWFQ